MVQSECSPHTKHFHLTKSGPYCKTFGHSWPNLSFILPFIAAPFEFAPECIYKQTRSPLLIFLHFVFSYAELCGSLSRAAHRGCDPQAHDSYRMCHDHDGSVSALHNINIQHKKFGCNGKVIMSLFCSVPAIIKVHGAHLKASAAMVRLRLYDILALLPPKTYEGKSCLACN